MSQFNQYKEQGLEQIVFPCSQFGGQELKSNAEVLAFTDKKEFGGTVMDIGDVTGPNARPSWKFFYENAEGAHEPTWNFKGKFLVSRSGKVEVPTDLENDIQRLLGEKWEGDLA